MSANVGSLSRKDRLAELIAIALLLAKQNLSWIGRLKLVSLIHVLRFLGYSYSLLDLLSGLNIQIRHSELHRMAPGGGFSFHLIKLVGRNPEPGQRLMDFNEQIPVVGSVARHSLVHQ